MGSAMGIRRVIEHDIEAVHPLLEQLMPAELNRRRTAWSEAVKNEGYAAWVAEEDGTPVGFIDLFLFPDVAHGSEIGLINNLVVDTRFRGRGFGESLLREAIHHCQQQGVAELHVWTDPDNTPAIELYKKLRFLGRARLLELPL